MLSAWNNIPLPAEFFEGSNMVNPDNYSALPQDDELNKKYIKISYPNGQVGFMMPDEIMIEDDDHDPVSLELSGDS